MGFLSCFIAVPHGFWTHANELYRLTACDKSLSLMVMANSYHLNNRAVFDKAPNIVSDVPLNTPRI